MLTRTTRAVQLQTQPTGPLGWALNRLVQQVHVQGKNITRTTAASVGSVPMHPGALRYFKETGTVK